LGGRIAVGRYPQTVLGQLGRIFGRGTVAGLSEATLLGRFVSDRDETALAAIVARHGPMVLGVCRRLLRDEHDVEDAFQATFLVLVRRAGAIRDGDRVGPWLYGVAHRVAVRARANTARRQVHERTSEAVVREAPAPPPADAAQPELRTVLDDELARLPDWMRIPLVLCYLEGLTHEEAAQRLGWRIGTVRSRMARARDRLRRRLSRHGFPGDEATLTALLAPQTISTTLLDATVSASLGYASRSAASAVTSTTAAALAQGVLNAMMIAKLKFLGAAALVCLVAVAGVQTYALQFGGMGPTQAPTSEKPPAKNSDQPAALIQRIDAIRAELAESTRRNAELQKRVEALAADLEALRGAQPPAPEPARPDLPLTPKNLKDADPGKVELEARPVPSSTWIFQGRALMIIAPEGDKATVYYPATRKAMSIRLSEDSKTPHEVQPADGGSLVALSIKGPKITRVAVFDEHVKVTFNGNVTMSSPDLAWYPVDLREPVDEAVPLVTPGSVVYVVGRRIYAFTSEAKRWDVLELPEGTEPTPLVGPNSITYENEGHIYTFDMTLGKWVDLDLSAILNAPEDQDNAKSKLRSTP